MTEDLDLEGKLRIVEGELVNLLEKGPITKGKLQNWTYGFLRGAKVVSDPLQSPGPVWDVVNGTMYGLKPADADEREGLQSNYFALEGVDLTDEMQEDVTMWSGLKANVMVCLSKGIWNALVNEIDFNSMIDELLENQPGYSQVLESLDTSGHEGASQQLDDRIRERLYVLMKSELSEHEGLQHTYLAHEGIKPSGESLKDVRIWSELTEKAIVYVRKDTRDRPVSGGRLLLVIDEFLKTQPRYLQVLRSLDTSGHEGASQQLDDKTHRRLYELLKPEVIAQKIGPEPTAQKIGEYTPAQIMETVARIRPS